MKDVLVTTIHTSGGQPLKVYKKATIQEQRLAVKSGNPYRAAGGRFGHKEGADLVNTDTFRAWVTNRDPKAISAYIDDPKNQAAINETRKIFAKTYPKGITVYRGLELFTYDAKSNRSYIDDSEVIANLKSIEKRGFESWTSSQSEAEKFGRVFARKITSKDIYLTPRELGGAYAEGEYIVKPSRTPYLNDPITGPILRSITEEMTTLEGDTVTIQEMSKKVSVRSGNPYRADGGRFGTGGDGTSNSDEDLKGLGTAAAGQTSLAKQKKYNAKLEQLRADFAKRNKLSLGESDKLMDDWVEDSFETMDTMELANMDAYKGNGGLMSFEYAFTQAYFKANGIKEITLYRGIVGEPADALGKQLDSRGKALFAADWSASWSDTASVAEGFASQEGKAGLFVTRKIPVSQIMSTWITNPRLNSFGENEYIVADPKPHFLNTTEVEHVE